MTFGQYGDWWGDPSGGTTKNLLRQLYSSDRAAEMLLQEERASGFKYDAIFATRLDVLVTHPVPVDAYAALRASSKRGELLVFTPNWGKWGFTGTHVGGVNDRIMLGHRDAVLPVLQRFRVVPTYMERGKKLHAETFLKWVYEDMKNSTSPAYVTSLTLRDVSWLNTRRVRVKGALAEYQGKKQDDCSLTTMANCTLAAVGSQPACAYTEPVVT